MEKIYYTDFHSPFGRVFAAKTVKGVCSIDFSGMDEAEFLSSLKKMFREEAVKDKSEFGKIQKVLLDYFNGELRECSFPLDLRAGTQFQRKVWKKLMDIPYGELRSYKWVAGEIGDMNASRAVGNAVGANPLPPAIPCHRVVCSDGSLGGYSSGIHLKKRLLTLEGIQKVY
ncbi:MAG: methylated-DNA--[protein]-cysteine S-methyltransferase [Candidatus Scalindua sp.]|nr:methylated-DNA--[protein]-cysteine S-methyltransferase [Candidatus Scalindua sp.]